MASGGVFLRKIFFWKERGGGEGPKRGQGLGEKGIEVEAGDFPFESVCVYVSVL